jgi:hypothetical protein
MPEDDWIVDNFFMLTDAVEEKEQEEEQEPEEEAT